MASYFITGTGTDIGKTWLTCALLRYWRAAGITTKALKPVMSGVDMADLDASDAGQLLQAQGQLVSPATVAEISPWRFAAPLSPDQAARREGRSISFNDLLAWNRRVASADLATVCLTEGVGGVYVPLDDQHTVLDWMAGLAHPVVLVGGSYLGSMSHTLTALLTLRTRNIEVAAVAINETAGSDVPLGETLASLTSHAGGVRLVTIERSSPERGIADLANALIGP